MSEERCVYWWTSLSAPVNISQGPSDLARARQHSANGQTNNKSENSREGALRSTESARETFYDLCPSEASIQPENSNGFQIQVFLKFLGSNETIIWGYGLCLVVNVLSGRLHFTALHNTNPPTAAAESSGAERGLCRQL